MEGIEKITATNAKEGKSTFHNKKIKDVCSVVSDDCPALFDPIEIRGMQLRNRIVVSPMGMYSSYPDGRLTDFHLMHHGQFALRDAALTMVEVSISYT